MSANDLFHIGFNHLLASVAARERAAVPEAAARQTLLELARDLKLEEAVLLSTCSRLELYAAAGDPEAAVERARAWFLARGGPELAGSLVQSRGAETLTHLFRVAAGLDSWIIGESEILGQVKRAYETAKGAGLTAPRLNRAFQGALAAGKAARAQTGIQNGISSIGGAAALLARSIFGPRDEGSIVVFGAGEAAEAAVRHLAVKGFREIHVANRTLERAEELAGRVGGRAVSLERGFELLAEAAVAVFSTASPMPLLEAEALRGIMTRRSRPLFLVDLGMPRNVAPGCAALSGAFLYDLDDLKAVVARSMAGKADQKREAEGVVARLAERCVAEMEKASARRAPQEASA
jgi:glutamyl-tRNA reductase